MATHQNVVEGSRGGWFVGRRLWMSGVFLSMLWFVGCDKANRAAPAKPALSPAEEDFEWVIERLNRAVKDFRPSSSAGFVVNREMSYEMFPPSDESEYYTATITIKSKTTYDRHLSEELIEGVEIPEKKKKEEFDPEVYALPGEFGSDPELEKIPGIELDPTPEEEPRIAARELIEQDEYDLVYQDDRWQLVDSIEVEHIKLWFEYALTE